MLTFLLFFVWNSCNFHHFDSYHKRIHESRVGCNIWRRTPFCCYCTHKRECGKKKTTIPSIVYNVKHLKIQCTNALVHSTAAHSMNERMTAIAYSLFAHTHRMTIDDAMQTQPYLLLLLLLQQRNGIAENIKWDDDIHVFTRIHFNSFCRIEN